MKEYIDKEIARSYLEEACACVGGNGGLMLKLKFDEEPAADVRENVQPQWILCSDRLPEEDYAVLVWCPCLKNIFCAYFERGKWWIFGAYGEVPTKVKAWMPLPDPMEGEEDG